MLPPVAGPSSASDLAPTSLNSAVLPPVTGSSSCAPVPAALPVSTPAPVLPLDPVLDPASTPALALSDDSQDTSVTQNNTPTLLVAPAAPTEPSSCSAEATTSSATSESSTDPSTSALGPGGNSDERIDSQEA